MVGRKEWRMCREAITARFERPVAEGFLAGEVDLEALWGAMLPPASDFVARGRILIGNDLRLALAEVANDVANPVQGSTEMTALFPRTGRRQAWADLQSKLDWKLPRIGLPIWAQYAWGAGLIAALVLMFWWPIIGTLAFFGGIILSYRAEKWAVAFQYPTYESTLAAMVRLNYPALEVGGGDDLPLRLLFAEALDSHFIPIDDPEATFPSIIVQDPFAKHPTAVHVLNGDALRATFQAAEIPGERVVVRECFVVGPIPASLDDWQSRSAWIEKEYGAPPEKYRAWVTLELDRLRAASQGQEFLLWFEDDLFCQVNLWFVLAFLAQVGKRDGIYRVFPTMQASNTSWDGFGGIDEAGFCESMAARVPFSLADLQLGKDLWEAFRLQDNGRMLELAQTPSPCFRDLPGVVQAHIDRFPGEDGLGKPERTLLNIMASGKSEFSEIFAEFSLREGIYGFGDLQVQGLLQRISSAKPQIP